MTNYLLAGIVIVLINLIPAFAPPTWAVLVYFVLNQHLNPIALVIIGVCCATVGRAGLALYFRRIINWFPAKFIANMELVALKIESNKNRTIGVLALFFLSPISSAQLFEAAGIVKKVSLKPLLLAFAAGRFVSYSGYVYGAKALKESSLGGVLTRELTSSTAIEVQILVILSFIALGNKKWKQKS